MYPVPFQSPVTDSSSILTRAWENFFRKIQDVVNYIRDEEVFNLENNQSSPANIAPLAFDNQITSHAVIEYFVQRIHSTPSENLQAGRLTVFYRYNTFDWVLTNTTEGSSGSPGVTFSITSTGQIQYTTTNISGLPSLSRITFRVREIKAKSALYSKLG